jgi:hypothetical protein
MRRQLVHALLPAIALSFGLAGVPNASFAQAFKYDDKTNGEMARRLDIPVWFVVPKSAEAALPEKITTKDKLVAFKHPDGKGADAGLRLIVTKRSGMRGRLARSGLVQTGDIILSMRPEWGGANAYTNIQMGITHSGIAYVKNGEVHNLDNPMNSEFLGSGLRGTLSGKHYDSIRMLHIIRPRGVSETQKRNLIAWIERLTERIGDVYPGQLAFNQDYNTPKYRPGSPSLFVKQLGQIALQQKPPGPIDMFCSEFLWSLLALKDCDPRTSADAFKASGMPACIKEPLKPMLAVGDYTGNGSTSSNAGLGDGPLLVVRSLDLPEEQGKAVLRSVFDENPERLKKISTGHLNMSKEVQSKFNFLRAYYVGSISRNPVQRARSWLRGWFIRNTVPQNYSPTAFLINTLLPSDNQNRSMDYVATVLIE